MLTVVCWKWRPAAGYRSRFEAEQVRILRNMVGRHYAAPHRFVCITDDPAGLDDIETLPLWDTFADVPSPHGPRNPSCYRRLRLFAPDAATLVGERFVSVDLDTVIVRDMRPLWDRPEDFVVWGETDRRSWYNGSMWLLRAGTRPQVWTRFNPRTSPMEAKRAGRFGSDQGWISHVLGPGEAMWGRADGVYSFRVHLAPQGGALPPDARIVMFHGKHDPWSYGVADLPWVKAHYR